VAGRGWLAPDSRRASARLLHPGGVCHLLLGQPEMLPPDAQQRNHSQHVRLHHRLRYARPTALTLQQGASLLPLPKRHRPGIFNKAVVGRQIHRCSQTVRRTRAEGRGPRADGISAPTIS